MIHQFRVEYLQSDASVMLEEAEKLFGNDDYIDDCLSKKTS